MDPRRTLLIVVMNRIIQPEIFCEDLQSIFVFYISVIFAPKQVETDHK